MFSHADASRQNRLRVCPLRLSRPFIPRLHTLKLAPALLVAAPALSLTSPAQAQQTFTVTTTSDSGPGSLRQALTQSNDNSRLPADTIAFAPPAGDPGYDAATRRPTTCARPNMRVDTPSSPTTLNDHDFDVVAKRSVECPSVHNDSPALRA